jgi:hypothetical protein
MGVAKQQLRPKSGAKAPPKGARPAKTPGTKFAGISSTPGLKPATKKGKPPSGHKAPVESPQSPLTDEQVGAIPGLPNEADIERQIGNLSPEDKKRFSKIRKVLARRLGSYAAARVWLTTPGRGFDGSPLDAIREGQADLVLEVLKDQSSPSPPYA